MATRRSSQLTVVRPALWQRQTLWDTPLDAALMTQAINVTSRNYLDIDETVEEVFDCTGEDLLFELVTAQFARLILEMDVDPDELAGWVALGYGVAAAPSGGTNEIWTQTPGTATAGTYQIAVTRNYNRQVTTALAFDADAATIQAALQALSNVGAGNVVSAGVGPITHTFQGALASTGDILVEIVSALTGGTSHTIAETTPGVGRSHAVSRVPVGVYSLPFTTFYVGHRGSSEQPVIFKNVVVNSIRCRSASREKVTATIELIGSADLAQTVGYTMPACVDIEPIRFGDCSLTINGHELYSGASIYGVENGGIAVARDFEYGYDNGILTGNHAFTGTGIHATRFERSNRRPSYLNIGVLGEPNDTLYDMAHTRSTVAAVLRVGPPSNFVRFNVPQALLKLDNPRVRYEGDAEESHLRLVARPRKITGDATTPSNVTAVTNQAGAYLNAA